MEYLRHISKVFIFIFALLLIVGIGQGAPMDNTPCTFFPDNATTPNGYAEIFDYNEASVLGADYYVIKWTESNGTNISVNTSAIPQQAYIEVGSIALTHNDYQVAGAFKPLDSLNGTILYNFTIIGYNTTDSLSCPSLDFLKFEGRIEPGAPLNNFGCTVGLPDNFTVPHGHTLTVDLRDNTISGADYHTISWTEEDNETFLLNFSDVPNDYFDSTDDIYYYYQDFAQITTIGKAPYLNGTTIYNVTIRGYNATDSVVCPVVDFVTFEGRNMGIFEIAITTPYMIFMIFMILIGIGLSVLTKESNLNFIGSFLVIISGVVLLLSSFNVPISVLIIAIGAMLWTKD